MDFFQIPNGAYAFLHGGSLNGTLPTGVSAYTNSCCGVNSNVYHPLFTLLVGVPLQFLRPQLAMTLWILLHLLLMAVLVFFLWRKFRKHKYIYLALSILLLVSFHYYEILLAQYQFLLNFFTILFLYESTKHGDTEIAGIWLFLSLPVKPIGLLWIVPLLIYKRYKTVAIGFGLYVLVTFYYTVFPFKYGQYYVKNFFMQIRQTIPSYNIYAIHFLNPAFQFDIVQSVGILLVICLFLFQFLKRPNIFIIIFLWISYSLLFYSITYHYHYTILAGLLCLGILFNVFSPKKIVLLPIIFLLLPSPIFLFYLGGDRMNKPLPNNHSALLILYSIFWLVCLLFYITVTPFRINKKGYSDLQSGTED